MSNWLRKKSPAILSCVGVIGVVATTVLAIRATPKAMELLEDAEKDSDEELSVVDKIRIAGPVYIPTAVMGVSTVACICGVNLLNQKQQASLMTAYGMIDAGYKNYRKKVKELCSDTTVEKGKTDVISEDSSGKLLWYEPYRDEFFELSEKEVIDAEYHMNRNFILRGEADLNDFYEFLGLTTTDIGSEVGWEITDDGRVFENPWIDFEHHLVIPEDGKPEYYRIEIIPPSGVLALDEY